LFESDLRDNTHTFSGVAAFQSFDVRANRLERVTPGYFKLLGVEPHRGRLFADHSATEAVLSYAYWRKEFNLDPKILGRNVLLGDETYTVIGIASPEFSGVNSTPAALWVPLRDLRRDRGNYGAVHVIARLKPGVPLLAADSDANSANRRGLIADGIKPGADLMQLGPLPITQGPNAPKEINVAIWLASVAGLVLLIGGANIVQLLLAQSLARKNETAIRLALGASPTRLLRQWWAETLLLASLGAAASLAVAAIATPAAQSLLIPAYKQPILSVRVLLATVVITILSALILATIPAWHNPSASSGLRSALITVQIALTIVLLVGASLFVRSLVKVQQIDTGFALDQLVVVNLETPRSPSPRTARGSCRWTYQYRPFSICLAYALLCGRRQLLQPLGHLSLTRSCHSSRSKAPRGQPVHGSRSIRRCGEPPIRSRIWHCHWPMPTIDVANRALHPHHRDRRRHSGRKSLRLCTGPILPASGSANPR